MSDLGNIDIPMSGVRADVRARAFSMAGRSPGVLFSDIKSRLQHDEAIAYGAKRAHRLHLTFDDGPTPGHTERLLDLLLSFGAQATFFVNTINVSPECGTIARALNEGHEIASHGHAHIDAWRVSAAGARSDLDESVARLARCGVQPRWFRPPHGHVRPCHLRWMRTHPIRMAMWDVMPGDFVPGLSAADVTRNVIRLARPGSIVVLHDNSFVASTGVTLDAVEHVLKHYLAEEWSFRTLSGS